ncbi:MAG: putative molybdenum carrier protein [Gammaproteobacteria bacterium]
MPSPTYTLLEPLAPARAHIRFTGRFEGRAVTWDAQIIALRATGSLAAPYIEIGADGAHGRALRVGLPLATLDAPTLAKTVIMIRNYKRLRQGRMHFGETAATPVKIISGGQTGVDRAALDAARLCGIAIGGYCPKGRRAEDGPVPAHYPLTELRTADYPTRTRRNARAADATLILTRGPLSGGSAYTARIARQLEKPLRVVDLSARPRVAPVRAWLSANAVRVLNVAGPRESKAPGIYRQAKRFLLGLWAKDKRALRT